MRKKFVKTWLLVSSVLTVSPAWAMNQDSADNQLKPLTNLNIEEGNHTQRNNHYFNDDPVKITDIFSELNVLETLLRDLSFYSSCGQNFLSGYLAYIDEGIRKVSLGSQLINPVRLGSEQSVRSREKNLSVRGGHKKFFIKKKPQNSNTSQEVQPLENLPLASQEIDLENANNVGPFFSSSIPPVSNDPLYQIDQRLLSLQTSLNYLISNLIESGFSFGGSLQRISWHVGWIINYMRRKERQEENHFQSGKISSLKRKIGNLNSTIGRLRGQLDEKKKEDSSLFGQRFVELSKDNTKFRDKNQILQNALRKFEQELAEKEKILEKKNDQYIQLLENYSGLQQRSENQRKTYETQRNTILELQKIVEDYKASDLGRVTRERDSFKAELEKLEKEFEGIKIYYDQLESKTHQESTLSEQRLTTIQTFDSKIKSLEERLQEFQQKNNILQQKNTELENTLLQFQEENEKLKKVQQEEIGELRKLINEFKEFEEFYKKKIADLNSKIENQKKSAQQQESSITKKNEEIKNIKDNIKRETKDQVLKDDLKKAEEQNKELQDQLKASKDEIKRLQILLFDAQGKHNDETNKRKVLAKWAEEVFCNLQKFRSHQLQNFIMVAQGGNKSEILENSKQLMELLKNYWWEAVSKMPPLIDNNGVKALAEILGAKVIEETGSDSSSKESGSSNAHLTIIPKNFGDIEKYEGMIQYYEAKKQKKQNK